MPAPRRALAARDPATIADEAPRAHALGLAVPDFLRALDLRFAEFVVALEQKLGGEASGELWLAAAVASHGIGAGRACVPLAELADHPWPALADSVADEPHSHAPYDAVRAARELHGGSRAPTLDAWLARLRLSRAVARPGDLAPLVLDGAGRIYLHRYWEHERNLATDLRARAERAAATPIDPARLARDLETLDATLASRDITLSAAQRAAIAAAVHRSFTVISGGAGTGKTTIVACVLKLLAEQARAAGLRMRVALAAPTGKAAHRLREQIETLRGIVDPEDAIATILQDAPTTLHRLLGINPERAEARRSRRSPLVLDALVVDETSMVDLELMARTVDALPAHARLVLLGDKDQLPPVEVGSILGDLCRTDALGDAVVVLDRTHRFTAESGIARLAQAIRAGDRDAVRALLDEKPRDVEWIASPGADGALPGALLHFIERSLERYVRAVRAGAAPREVLAKFGALRVLCVRRGGPDGVGALNRAIEDHLRRRRRLAAGGPWYPGRPVLVTRNDHALGLLNGDVGVTLRNAAGALRVYFERTGGTLRELAPGRLPHVETTFAMSVHKSQGSEFEDAVLVLPRTPSRLLSRELLYTAVTRARHTLAIVGSQERLDEGLSRTLPSASALADALRDS